MTTVCLNGKTPVSSRLPHVLELLGTLMGPSVGPADVGVSWRGRGAVGRMGLGGAVQAPCGAAARPAFCPQRDSLLSELGFQLGAEAVSFSAGGRVEAD